MYRQPSILSLPVYKMPKVAIIKHVKIHFQLLAGYNLFVKEITKCQILCPTLYMYFLIFYKSEDVMVIYADAKSGKHSFIIGSIELSRNDVRSQCIAVVVFNQIRIYIADIREISRTMDVFV